MENSEFLPDGAQTAARIDIELLGFPAQRGSMCEVRRVRQYGKQLLMKRLLPHHADKSQYQQALRKEFEAGYLLEHPNLVRYIGWGEDDKGSFLLQEYVDGWTLREFLAENPCYFDNQENERKFINQILSVLGFLHSHQIIHLDLKPDNILITRIGQEVKLIDLGCCYSDTFADTAGLNREFAAPEQLHPTERFQPAPHTDLYALGKVLEWMTKKKGCHLSRSAHRLMKALLKASSDDRPQSAEDALHLYLQKERHLRNVTIALASMAIVAIYLYGIRTHDNASKIDVMTEAPATDETIDSIETIVVIKPEPIVHSVSEPPQTKKTPLPETEQEADTFDFSSMIESTTKFYNIENAKIYIAENVDDGGHNTQLFIHDVDSVLQNFYSKLSEQYNPLTLDNYREYVAKLTDFGCEYRHFVNEASDRYSISSEMTKEISQRLSEPREMAENDRLFIFLSKNGLIKE